MTSSTQRQPLHEVMEQIEAHINQDGRVLLVCPDAHQMDLIRTTYPVLDQARSRNGKLVYFMLHTSLFEECQGFIPSPLIVNVTETPQWWRHLRVLYPDATRLFVNL